MFSLIRAEIYRVLHKRSFYIYFGVLAVLYAMFVVIRLSSLGVDSVGDDASKMFTFLPVLVGGYLFATLFNDDLSSKNLSTLIGFGISKAKIVLAKLLLLVGFGTLIFGLAPLFMNFVYALLGFANTGESLGIAYAYALTGLMATVAYAAIAAIAVYGLQRATFAIVLFIILTLGQVDQLVMMLFQLDFLANLVPDIMNHLLTGITTTVRNDILVGGNALGALTEYGVYIVVATALSVVAFNKKELEF
jgi:ABC-type transport system involved in multi-copper enzyme maturation permease subunit